MSNVRLIENPKDSTDYFTTIRKAKKAFYEFGEISTFVRKPIMESWKVDKRNGHDPSKESIYTLPSPESVQELLDKNRLLISISSSVINTICLTLNKIDFCLELCGPAGHLLFLQDQLNPKNVWNPLPSTRIGVNLCDDHATSNSIRLALQYKQDFSIYGSEHYCDVYDQLNCSASIIRGANNEILGVLNIQYPMESMNSLLPGLAVIAARLIARQLQQHTYQKIIDFTFDDISEGALVVDRSLEIRLANRYFMNMLGIENNEVIGLDIRNLFTELDFSGISSSDRQKTAITETMLHFNGKSYRLNANITKLGMGYNQDGYLILFREIRKIITLSQKFTAPALVNFNEIITSDKKMEHLITCCRNVASADIPILLEGESGTGKDLFAQSIHSASHRSDKPFIAVNCAALPMNLVESELFGYEKGAFTGALSSGKAGKFEQADGGTIFLDEIGELPLDIQSKLLRVLDNHKITRIGGKTEIKLNIRLISATNRNLEQEVKENNFRQDLFYRLNVMSFYIPPLRDRNGDIEAIAIHYLNKLNAEKNMLKTFSHDALEKLNSNPWKGNVRELQNTVIRAFYLCEAAGSDLITGDQITMHGITSLAPENPLPGQNNLTSLKTGEAQLIEKALASCNGNVKKSALLLDIPLSTLYKRIKQYNLQTKNR